MTVEDGCMPHIARCVLTQYAALNEEEESETNTSKQIPMKIARTIFGFNAFYKQKQIPASHSIL